MSEFEIGRSIGLKMAGGMNRTVARHLDRGEMRRLDDVEWVNNGSSRPRVITE